MTVKDLPHHVTFTVVFPIWGAVYSGMKRKQAGDVTNSKACQSLFNTLVSSCANLSLNGTGYFFLHSYLQSPRKYDLSLCSVLNTNT